MSREEEGGERTGSTDCYCVSARHLLVYFPSSWNKYGVYYIWGLFIFSVIVSVYGAVLLLYLKSRGVEESRSRGVEESRSRGIEESRRGEKHCFFLLFV